MQPVVQRLQAEGRPVRQIDIDQSPQLAARFGVSGVPCFVMLVDGREVDRVEGAVGYERLAQMFAAARPALQHAAPAAEIRGQSPDRAGLGGRFRQMLGGRRGEAGVPQQPSTTPPDVADGYASPYAAPGADAGPEPPAALGNFGPPPGASFGAPGVPEMAPNFQAAPLPQANAPAATQTWSATLPPAASPGAGVAPEQLALNASVRLKVDDGQFFSYATGSIIGRGPNGEVLILTCGHVFRDSQGRGAVSVELFGPQRQGPVPGRLIAFDLNRDLGLVSIPAPSQLPHVSLAASNVYLRDGLRVFSIGCDRGAEPTVREGRLAGVNRYLGTPNLVATGRPVVGRSGGGLFDSEGRLVGVCRFADGETDEGIYVSYQAIHTQLEEWGVGGVLEAASPATPLAGPAAPGATSTAPPQNAAAPPAADATDQPADFDYTAVADEFAVQNAAPAAASAFGASGSSLVEPVFIIRPGRQGPGDVMLVEQPSQAFLDQLARESKVTISDRTQLPQTVRVAAETLGLGAAVPGALMRGQSPWQNGEPASPAMGAVR
jgi:S1-C subfamily serine protease